MDRPYSSYMRCFVFVGLGLLITFIEAVRRNIEHPALPLLIQPNTLSILSIQYNPTPHSYSDWIERIFGDRAIFHNRSYDSQSLKKLQPQEFIERREIFQAFFTLPDGVRNASCSFEFFGFVPVNTHRPFTWGDKEYRPSMGRAFLKLDGAQEWLCIYRALYENPLHSLSQYRKQHWPIVFFCPVPASHSFDCQNLKAAAAAQRNSHPKRTLPAQLFVPLSNALWTVSLSIDLPAVTAKPTPLSRKRRQRKAREGPAHNIDAGAGATGDLGGASGDESVDRVPEAALCTAIPYTSSLEDRLEVCTSSPLCHLPELQINDDCESSLG